MGTTSGRSAARLATLAMLLVPMALWAAEAGDAGDAAFDQGRNLGGKIGGVLGVILGLGLYAWLFFLRTWREGEDAGFLFRLGVLLVAPIFAWGTLRSGFLAGARLTAFVWLAIQLVVWGSGATRLQQKSTSSSDELQRAFVQGCVRNPSATEEECECLARHFVQDHTLAQLEELAPAVTKNRANPELVAWAERTRARCAVEAHDAERAPDPSPGDPNAPPPDIARTSCSVTSTPPGAELLLDGKPTGVKTPGTVTLWAGRQNVLVARLPGRVLAAATLSPNLGQATQQDFQLAPGVDIALDSTPPGAEALVDGLPVATTPGTATLAEGPAVIIFRLAGHLDVQRPLTVLAKGRPLKATVELRPAATLQVESIPSGAETWVDVADTAGRTPRKLPVAAEIRHCVAMVLGGYVPAADCAVAAAPGQTSKMSLKLDRSTPGLLQDCRETAARAVAALGRERAKVAAKLKGKRVAQREALVARLEELDAELAARTHVRDACKDSP